MLPSRVCVLCCLGLSFAVLAANTAQPQEAKLPTMPKQGAAAHQEQSRNIQESGCKEQKTAVAPETQPKLAAKEADLLQLFSGPLLPVKLEAIDLAAKQMRVASELLQAPAVFKLGSVKALHFSPAPMQASNADTLVLMSNGDVINARLVNIGNDALELESAWGGKLNINKKFVANVSFRSLQNEFYSGPNSLEEWIISNPDLVTLEDSRLNFSYESQVYKQDMLQERVQVSFDLTFSGYANLRLLLFGKNKNDGKEDENQKQRRRRYYNRNIDPDSYYELILRPGTVYLHCEWNGEHGRCSQEVSRIDNFRGMPEEAKDATTVKIDVFADLKKGRFYIYCDGEKCGELIDDSRDDEILRDLGMGFGMGNGNSNGSTISNLVLRKWGGAAPRSLAERKSKIGSDFPKDGKSQGLQLANGDVVIGDVVEVKDGFFVLKSPNYETRLPLHLVCSLNVAGQAPAKLRKMQQDVQLRMQDSTRLTMQLRSLGKDKLQGWNEAMGEVEVDLAKVKSMEFNLYKIQ